MTDSHPLLEVLVEEPSAKQALDILVPAIVPDVECAVRGFRGKSTLLKELPNRLAGYATRARWEPLKIAVLVDSDDDDCRELKARLNCQARVAGLTTSECSSHSFQVLNRIVVTELESWFFGDIPALRRAYPKVPHSLGAKSKYRDPDSIKGGTWEALERVLQDHGYHRSGLRKLECARLVAPAMDVEANKSRSFQVFRDGLRRLISEGEYVATH